jgi:pectate lyase
MRMTIVPLVLLLAAATPVCSATKRKRPPAPPSRSSSPAYPGFGFRTTGGAGRPVLTVTTLADSGLGSLRDALAKAARDGGTIRFAVGGGIRLESGLDVPGRTTVDGSSAPAPGITLWGANAGAAGTGVVNVSESNVILRGLRIRDGMNDGVHIAPRRRRAVANIVVDHCSITNSRDGGVDITGRSDLSVTDVTLVANYIASNGGQCGKGLCGGGSLADHGATRLSYYYNFWDRNLRRTPMVRGADAVADVRFNVVRGTVQGGIQIREGARANLVGNTLEGSRGRTAAVTLWGGRAHVDGTPSDVSSQDNIAPLPVPHPPPERSAADVMREAGALPRDASDAN